MTYFNNTINTVSEDTLIELLRAGDNDGYTILYDSYSAMMYGVIKRIVVVEEDAENLLQDCFVKVWRNAQSYDATKGKLSTWLLNIARNTAIDFTRSKLYSQKQKNQNLDTLVNTDTISKSTSIKVETIGLDAIVKKLTPQYRDVIEWMYFEGYTQQEISDNFGVPLGTVKTRARLGLQELKRYFEL
jgi:RNA polymerase sigma-70 factor, ECF subfamily